MNRARLLALLPALAALAACGKNETKPQTVQLSRPSSVAAFRGVVFGSPEVLTYIAIANEARNDVSIVNAADDSPVLAPVSMKTLVVPVLRPGMLVSARLGDEGSPPTKADLLVAVSAGDSRLQLVRTWGTPNDVVDEATPVDFGYDILAAIALPSAQVGTARIAVALAGGRIGVATYGRSGDAIVSTSFFVSDPLGFQPVALAAVPDDTDHVYAATPDALPGGVHGVAEIDVGTQPSGPPTFAVLQALDARGPTRLVAAASLRERLSGSTAQDGTAFRDTAVPRVYAVLDEIACGTSERIDCGIAVLDPVAGRLLPDLTGRMPYLAPIQLPSRPLAIAVSQAPTSSPSPGYTGGLMRLWPATGELATTAVAAVPCEDGRIYFIDLSRWKVANDLALLSHVAATATSTSVDVRSEAGASLGTVRLWVADAAGAPLPETATADELRAQITVTPGYTRSDTFTVGYQSDLPSLSGRRAEVGRLGATSLWLAMTGTGGEPIRLWDPALGVHDDDVVVIQVPSLPPGTSCTGTDAPGAAAGGTKILETRLTALLAPTADYPGGAVELDLQKAVPDPDPVPVPADAPGPGEAVATWASCLASLADQVPDGTVKTGLTASIRAGGYVVSSALSGHLGRPVPGDSTQGCVPGSSAAACFVLEYPSPSKEDDPLCALVPWPKAIAGTACDAGCRSACEALLLARKTRRYYHVAESCAVADTACSDRWAGLTFPDVAGPLVQFRFALQPSAALPAEHHVPRRGLSLRVATSSGVSPFVAGTATGQGALVRPNGAATFDRSTLDPTKGYRFLVPYAGDFVIDTSPSIAGSDPIAIH